MRIKFSIFGKIAILICCLLIPILIIFTYVNNRSTRLVEDEIRKSKLKQLSVFMNQVNTQIEQLSMYSMQLMRDSDVLEFQNAINASSGYDRDKTINTIYEKLLLGSISSSYQNRITLYLPASDLAITTGSEAPFDRKAFMQDVSTTDWKLHPKSRELGQNNDYFSRYTVEPFSMYLHPGEANVIIQTTFPVDNLRKMMDDFKRNGGDDPFLFSPSQGLITNRSSDEKLVHALKQALVGRTFRDAEAETITLDGQNYMISVALISRLNWYVVDYVPIEQILNPIHEVRNLFYMSVCLLLILSILALLMLYRNVQIPIKQLIHSLREMKRGNFSIRMYPRRASEFSFVFSRFNEMAQEIQVLVEKVYLEKIQTREATLKQLQSQINPHFLYNCLFYIQSMIRLGVLDLAETMALNLGEYYRYTTRVEKQSVSLRGELGFVENYLEIQQMRMKRFNYEIHVPPHMMELTVPRLIIQPIVENAVVHGIENKPGSGTIKIHCRQDADYHYVIVEDNGVGMSQEVLRELTGSLKRSMDEEMGCGMWNVHQRLGYQYGEGSGLDINVLPTGGVRVVLAWRRYQAEGESDVSAAYCG